MPNLPHFLGDKYQERKKYGATKKCNKNAASQNSECSYLVEYRICLNSVVEMYNGRCRSTDHNILPPRTNYIQEN